jgi:hypothetical protein
MPSRSSRDRRLWRLGASVAAEWLADDERDAMRTTSYALLGFAISVFSYAVVAPPRLRDVALEAGALEVVSALVWWLYGNYESGRIERLPAYDRVWKVLIARLLATWWTIYGLVTSVTLLAAALLQRAGIDSARIASIAAGVILVAFAVGIAGTLHAYEKRRREFWLALYREISSALAAAPRTVGQLAATGLPEAYILTWLETAEAKGLVVASGPERSGERRWELTEDGASGLRREGFPFAIHAARKRPAGSARSRRSSGDHRRPRP